MASTTASTPFWPQIGQVVAQILANCIVPSTWDADLHVLPASPLLEGDYCASEGVVRCQAVQPLLVLIPRRGLLRLREEVIAEDVATTVRFNPPQGMRLTQRVIYIHPHITLESPQNDLYVNLILSRLRAGVNHIAKR